VFLRINGVQHYLWRPVDQRGVVIDILVQPKRDRFAAIRFFRKLLRTSGWHPRVIITDKLRTHGAARKALLPRVTHRQSRYLNNRAENSHQPTRQRERRMRRFNSPEHAQRFPKSMASSLLTSDRNDTFFLLHATAPNGRISLTHGGRPSLLEVHSAKKRRQQFSRVAQLVRAHVVLLQRNFTVSDPELSSIFKICVRTIGPQF
jgi:DDE domain